MDEGYMYVVFHCGVWGGGMFVWNPHKAVNVFHAPLEIYKSDFANKGGKEVAMWGNGIHKI